MELNDYGNMERMHEGNIHGFTSFTVSCSGVVVWSLIHDSLVQWTRFRCATVSKFLVLTSGWQSSVINLAFLSYTDNFLACEKEEGEKCQEGWKMLER